MQNKGGAIVLFFFHFEFQKYLLTILTRIVEAGVVRARCTSESGRTNANKLSAVVVVTADDASLLRNTASAILARTVVTSLTAQLAEASVISDRTDTFVRTSR